ncbi:hypothetical protein [Nocardia sp. bgisy134]|uniref:hypothetical protein n=1 Tax=Nocardia sp. bgisy134 TaxID=3413789 RepID=UPI003D725783
MNGKDLIALLPAVYRLRDEQLGNPLRELLDVIAEQLTVIDDSLDQFYDDQFIETCAEWVAPYIGDLIGYRPLHGVVPAVASPRAEVANTIRFRRRKGTASMLEQLARDVTGWPARAVEFFELLTCTQYMNHIRHGRGGTPSLREPTLLEFGGSAFDNLPHTPDVRGVATGEGRYNVPNIGIFLWRVAAVPLRRSPLPAVDDGNRRFRFDPLGTDQPLYGSPRTEDEISHLAEPFDVPIPLSRRWLSAHRDHYYGSNNSVSLEVIDGTVPATIRICDLSDVVGDWAHAPAPGSDTVAIDPMLGRVYFSDPPPNLATVVGTFHYGTALNVGGGGYDRGDPPVPDNPAITVESGAALRPPLDSTADGGVVEIVDNWRYEGTPRLAPNVGARLTLRSANRHRPLLLTRESIRLEGDVGSTVVIDGLLIAGGPLVLIAHSDVEPRHLVLRHCTLVPGLTRNEAGEPTAPGDASLWIMHPFASVTIDRCVLGPIVAVDGATVSIKDSIIDAGTPEGVAYTGDEGFGAALRLDGSTVVGRVRASRVDISNSLIDARLPRPPTADDAWSAPVWAERRQIGCVRFSYLPLESRVPRRYRTEPAEPPHRPHFTSLRYGDPGYAQLRPSTPDAIRRGADDGGEMGVTHYLHEPQREINLRLRLDEYLRFGLEAGFIYAD